MQLFEPPDTLRLARLGAQSDMDRAGAPLHLQKRQATALFPLTALDQGHPRCNDAYCGIAVVTGWTRIIRALNGNTRQSRISVAIEVRRDIQQ
jgi:hypothetical protein